MRCSFQRHACRTRTHLRIYAAPVQTDNYLLAHFLLYAGGCGSAGNPLHAGGARLGRELALGICPRKQELLWGTYIAWGKGGRGISARFVPPRAHPRPTLCARICGCKKQAAHVTQVPRPPSRVHGYNSQDPMKTKHLSLSQHPSGNIHTHTYAGACHG